MRMSTEVALCIASGGICAGGESKSLAPVQEAISRVLGWSVFTHELAEKATWDRAAHLVRGVPWLGFYGDWLVTASRISDEGARAAEIEKLVASAKERLGPFVVVPDGQDARRESPVASLERIAPDKGIIVVTTGEATE